MTAEIVVMNHGGVALAADSAVTIGQTGKIYASADKLFQLSSVAPVGVMFYGSAGIAGLPWETVVKTFRRRLGAKRFDSVGAYAQEFLRFVDTDRGLLSDSRRDRDTINSIRAWLEHLVGQFVSKMRLAEASGRVTDDEAKLRCFEEVLEEERRQVLAANVLASARRLSVPTLERRYAKEISNAIDERLERLPVKGALRSLLAETAIELLRRARFPTGATGLVFTGYGEAEYFPSFVNFEAFGFVGSRTRCLRVQSHEVERLGAAVIPLAQREVVDSFLSGLPDGMHRLTVEFMKNTLGALAKTIVETLSAASAVDGKLVGDALSVELPKLAKQLENRLTQARREHASPFLQVVEVLPKDELASMAEALVNLTKFRRRVTWDQETVGGPIDVAVITKGDGFVWVKRKHYFSAELNQRVVARIQHEGSK